MNVWFTNAYALTSVVFVRTSQRLKFG